MTYNTPTLLLVGAAQNLVLGSSPLLPPTEACVIKDNPLDGPLYHEAADW